MPGAVVALADPTYLAFRKVAARDLNVGHFMASRPAAFQINEVLPSGRMRGHITGINILREPERLSLTERHSSWPVGPMHQAVVDIPPHMWFLSDVLAVDYQDPDAVAVPLPAHNSHSSNNAQNMPHSSAQGQGAGHALHNTWHPQQGGGAPPDAFSQGHQPHEGTHFAAPHQGFPQGSGAPQGAPYQGAHHDPLGMYSPAPSLYNQYLPHSSPFGYSPMAAPYPTGMFAQYPSPGGLHGGSGYNHYRSPYDQSFGDRVISTTPQQWNSGFSTAGHHSLSPSPFLTGTGHTGRGFGSPSGNPQGLSQLSSPKRTLTAAQATDGPGQLPDERAPSGTPGRVPVGNGFHKFKYSEDGVTAALVHEVQKAFPPGNLETFTGDNVQNIDAYQFDSLCPRIRAFISMHETSLTQFDQLFLNRIVECPERNKILVNIFTFNFTTRRMLSPTGIFLEYFLSENGSLRTFSVDSHEALYMALEGMELFYGIIFGWYNFMAPFKLQISPSRNNFNRQLSVEYHSELVHNAAAAAARSYIQHAQEDTPFEEVRESVREIIARHAAVPQSTLTEAEWRSRTQQHAAIPYRPAKFLGHDVKVLQVASNSSSSKATSAPRAAPAPALKTLQKNTGVTVPSKAKPEKHTLCIKDMKHHYKCPISNSSDPDAICPPCTMLTHMQLNTGELRIHMSELPGLYPRGYRRAYALTQLAEHLTKDPAAATFMTAAVKADKTLFVVR